MRRNKNSFCCLIASILVCFVMLPCSAAAQDTWSWVGLPGGDWHTAGNWTPASVPLNNGGIFIGSGDSPVASSLVLVGGAGWIDMKIRKADGLRMEAVKIWRFERFIAVNSKVAIALVVGHDQDDVGALVGGAGALCGDGA